MDNPFPGMNPFLEDPACWKDFHHTFIGTWRESVANQLPDDYDARIGEHVYLVKDTPPAKKLAEPDVAIVKAHKRSKAKSGATVGASTLVPVTNHIVLVEEIHQGYIEILHRPKRNLVAVLELLSPANKGSGRKEYLAKRNAVLHQKVHLIELDLLLHGRRPPLGKPLPPGDYYYLVSDKGRRPGCDVYAWTLRDRLPIVPVPLLASASPIFCDLGEAFATAFQRGRYERNLLYTNNPRVRLPADEQQWARQIIRAARANG